MNVFAIKSVFKDVSFSTLFKGVRPFFLTDILRLLILIAFPVIPVPAFPIEMIPQLVTLCIALPPKGVQAALGRPGGGLR